MGEIDGGLRKLFREHIPQFDWCSIESGLTGGGIPDSNYCAPGNPGVEGWIEYKQTGGHAVTLKPEQVGWIARRSRYGGRVWIAVRQLAPAGPRREARDVLWLFPGSWAREAREHGLRGQWVVENALMWPNGPARWDWAVVAAVLAGRVPARTARQPGN